MILTLHGSSSTINSQGAYDFTNHIKSSMDIKPNSSIALVNATIERVSELIIGTNNGTIQVEIDDVSPVLNDIHIASGTYTTDSLADALQLGLNNQFNQHGYTFYVRYDVKAHQFMINWHEGSVKGAVGKPKFDKLQANLTQSITNQGTKLTIGNASAVGSWVMGVSSNALPDYSAFDEPHSANGGIYMTARCNVPDDGQVILGATAVEDFPNPAQNLEGLFGFKVKANGHVEISEGRIGSTQLDYIVGNSWTSNIGVPDVYVFHQYHGHHGYDYITIPNGNPANTNYIKKIGDGAILHKSTTDGAVFTLVGTLSADKLSIQWADLTGAVVETWTSATGAKLSNSASKVVYSKNNPTIALNNGLNNNGGGKISASWGSTGFVHYWFKNIHMNHWAEIKISSSDRVPVQEMFGDGQGILEYAGIYRGATHDAQSNNIFQMKSIVSSSLNIFNVDFSDANIYKQNEATYTPASPTQQYNKLVMGTTNPSQVIMRSTEDNFLNGNALGKMTYGEYSFSIPNGSQNQAWTAGLMRDEFITGISANGNNRGLPNFEIGVQNYDNAGTYGLKVWFNNAQMGNFKNYATMGDNPRIVFKIKPSGDCEVYYKSSADNYIQLQSFHSAVITLNSKQWNLLPMVTASNTGNTTLENITLETEKLTQQTGLVHFNANTMADILGMTNQVQASDDGANGFVSTKTPDVAPNECDNPTIHLQLKNLPIISMNGKTSMTEKSLAIIPRYIDNTHSAQGLESVLYYEPNNLLYKGLDNPQKLALNSVQVQLTNNDGTLAKDVTCFDCTLDIRPTGY